MTARTHSANPASGNGARLSRRALHAAKWRPFKHSAPLLLAALAATLCGPVLAMEALGDAALSAVRGRDGVSFDLNGFAMSGDVRVTYTAPNGASIYKENMSASRSDSADAFADPYKMDIITSQFGLADTIRFAFPKNVNGEQRWQYAYDWGVNANGMASQNGAVVVSDMVFYGGGLQFSTPQVNDGIAWGAALRVDIGQIALRPYGRADASEQMAFSNVKLGAVDGNGNFTGQPWELANVASQPGVLNALNDESGPRLHLGIDWPDGRYGNGSAPAGGLAIGNISFSSPNGGAVDLGSSRIGSMQIQYLDIKFRR